MKFIWNVEYGVGVEEFDEQHRHFFELASEISDLSEKADIDREILLKSISEFGDYAYYHMSSEEGYFRKYGYPDAPEHVAAHNIYRSQVKEYLERARESASSAALIARELAEFSAHWLAKHILEMDQKYTSFFLDKDTN